jgi:hypothetical protein
MYSVFFTDPNVGTVVGYYGYIFKTTNGGLNWTMVTGGTSPSRYSVWFTDASTGFLAGTTLSKTTDGGNTWQGVTTGHYDHHSVFFADHETGFVSGSAGSLFRTTDGGGHWTEIWSGTARALESVFFVDKNMGYMAGSNGTILKTLNSGGFPVSIEDPSPPSFSSSMGPEIFPNPVNGRTTIRIPASILPGSLVIRDMRGERLFTKDLTYSELIVDLSGYPSGIYFVQFIANNGGVYTKKLIRE